MGGGQAVIRQVWDIGRGFLSWERGGEERGGCLLVIFEPHALDGLCRLYSRVFSGNVLY